jgi:hypothetical protein
MLHCSFASSTLTGQFKDLKYWGEQAISLHACAGSQRRSVRQGKGTTSGLRYQSQAIANDI